MAGDFSRWNLDWATRYQAILMQQGRVTLDADWNAYALARADQQRREIVDVVGPAAAPKANAGFKIETAGAQLTIGGGRYYVAGIACRNDPASGGPLPWTAQPFMPSDAKLPTDAGEYLAYLDVWSRIVDAWQDSQLAEVALGGVDTVVGLQQLWQVKLIGPNPPKPWPLPQYTALMQARVENSLGLGNWLYRIEVHYPTGAGGAPQGSFKWSRKNAAVSAGIVAWAAAVITLAPGPAALETLFQVGNWVEFVDDDVIFGGIAAPLWQVAAIDGTSNTITVAVPSGRMPPLIDASRHPLLRRWDQGAIGAPNLVDGTIPIVPGSWIPVEDGIQVQFAALTPPLPPVATGDFWSFSSRAATGAIDWPADGGKPHRLPKSGIWHNYAALALLATDGKTWKVSEDQRVLFAPIGDIVRSMQELEARVTAVEGRPAGRKPPK